MAEHIGNFIAVLLFISVVGFIGYQIVEKNKRKKEREEGSGFNPNRPPQQNKD